MADTACVGLVLGTDHRSLGVTFFNRRGFRRLCKWSVCDAAATECRTQFRCHAGDDGAPADDRRRTVYSGAPDVLIRKHLEYLAFCCYCCFLQSIRNLTAEIFLLYLAGYGIGRFWIEGLRTDQLLLPGIKLPVSQVLSAVVAIVSIAVILIQRKRCTAKKTV